jgi:hypothetical protein
MDRLNTRNILKMKKYKIEGNNYNCILCNGNMEETAFHLFFSCPLSKACQDYQGIQWRIFFDKSTTGGDILMIGS